MTSHLDPDVLADYREGLLGGRRSARIREHLDGCPQCSSLDAGLAEVTQLLASAPTPPMPEHLVTRLENALAVEAAAWSGAAAAGNGAAGTVKGEGEAGRGPAARTAAGPGGRQHRIWRGQPGPGKPGQGRRRGGWGWGPVLGAAAAIVIILVAGVYGLARAMHQSTPESAAGPNALAPRSSHLGTSPGPGSQGAQTAPRYNPSLPAGSLHVIASGTDYQPGKLSMQVELVLSPAGPNSGNVAPAGKPALASSPRLRACVTLVTGGRPPRLVDVASYQGKPATVIVEAVASGKPAQVWVVGSGCSAGQRDVIAHTEITTGG